MKKIITLMLALIMVFAMAVPAFAQENGNGNDSFVPSIASCDHVWDDGEEVEGGIKHTCEICGVTIIEYYDGVNEENPETGSSVVLAAAALVAAAAAVSFKRKK